MLMVTSRHDATFQEALFFDSAVGWSQIS